MNRMIVFCLSLVFSWPAWAHESLPARAEVEKVMQAAATYSREKHARHGGYVYYTSKDLSQRWGEGAAGPDTILVQPPGTPTSHGRES